MNGALGAAIAALIVLSWPAAPGDSVHAGTGSLAERIREEAVEFIAGRVVMPYDSLSVELALPAIAARSSDVAHFAFDLFESSKPVVGTVPFKLNVVLHSGEAIPYTVTARVRIWSNAAVAARRLKRHSVIAEQDVRFEKREVTQAVDGYFVALEHILGNRTTRTISPGGLLMLSSVEPVPLVTRGSNVSVTVVVGAVAVTSRAKALEDGDLGSLIEVRNTATGKRITGEVAGENRVVIDVSRL